jgi:plasmid stability protein
MAAHTVTLQLPSQLYKQLVQRAAEARRSVEAELLELVAAVMPSNEKLAPDLAHAIEGLAVLEDDALWQAARHRLTDDVAARLEELQWKRQSSGLSSEEDEELSRLVSLYERRMLVRAQAAKLLHDRGHDVSPLLREE